MKITKDMLIGEVLDIDSGAAEFFFEIGMHCLGCPASRGESIEQACEVHGTDCDALVEKLIKYKKIYISSGDTLWAIAKLEQSNNKYFENK